MPYRSLDLIFEKINQEIFQPVSVVNYPNEEDYTRITEFKHFTNSQNRDKIQNFYTILLKEYPLSYDHQKSMEPYYPVINEANIRIYQKYSSIVNIFSNFYLCGRLAEYKYYNMDTVIEKALNFAEEIKAENAVNKRHNLLKEIFLYGIIGSFSAGLDSVIFFLLRKATIHLYFSNFIGINAGILTSFILNAFINFKTTDRLLRRAVRFFSVGYIGLLLSMVIIFFGVEVLGYREIIIKIFSVIIIAVFQFTLNKIFTFRKAKIG